MGGVSLRMTALPSVRPEESLDGLMTMKMMLRPSLSVRGILYRGVSPQSSPELWGEPVIQPDHWRSAAPCVWASELSLCVCEQQEAPLAFAWYSWCRSLEKQTVWPITLKRFQLSVCPSLISVRAVLITTSSMLVFITSFPKTNWKPSLIGKADGYKSKTFQSSWADWKPDRRWHKLISLTDWEDGSMGCGLVFMLTFTCVDTVSCSLIKNSSNEFLINKAALNRVCMWSLLVFLSTVDGYCPTLNNCQQGSCRSGVFRIQKYI